VGGEILPAIRFRGPIWVKRQGVVAQFVANSQRLGGRHLRFLLRPSPLFELGDGLPVAARECNHVLFAHQPRIAPGRYQESLAPPPPPSPPPLENEPEESEELEPELLEESDHPLLPLDRENDPPAWKKAER